MTFGQWLDAEMRRGGVAYTFFKGKDREAWNLCQDIRDDVFYRSIESSERYFDVCRYLSHKYSEADMNKMYLIFEQYYLEGH